MEFDSRVTTDSYAAVMDCWPYRPDLDWVAESPDGRPVASALGWLDHLNHAGLIEPVGSIRRTAGGAWRGQ